MGGREGWAKYANDSISFMKYKQFSQSESDTEMTLEILNSLKISGLPSSHRNTVIEQR